MSVAARVELLHETRGAAGLGLTLRTVGLARSTRYDQQHRMPPFAAR